MLNQIDRLKARLDPHRPLSPALSGIITRGGIGGRVVEGLETYWWGLGIQP